jgi:hypothetical protein
VARARGLTANTEVEMKKLVFLVVVVAFGLFAWKQWGGALFGKGKAQEDAKGSRSPG